MPTVRCGDADIHYYIAGEGLPVMLIMGLAADSSMWVMQTPVLASQYQVITLDNRGVGRSSAPEGPYSMETMATDALAVLDASGVERAHVVGISMGGAIAQELALKAPERLRSLVLVSTWAERNAYTSRLEHLGRVVLEELGREELIRASMLWLFSPRVFIENPELIETIEAVAISMQGSEQAFLSQVAAVSDHHLIDRLHEIETPTLVLVGRRDVLVPPELSERIAARMPKAELRMIDGGHAFNVENAPEFNAELLNWLAAH